MRDPNVVVFGGSGFIGSHLLALLAQEGIPALVPVRHAARVRHLTTLPGVDVVEADIHDDATLRRLLAGRTAALNLVGILHGSRAQPYGPEFRRAHVELPQRIVDACRASGVPRYLHMSALGANVNGPSMYSRSKADGELAARSHPEVAATIFRPSVVFGPGDHFLTMFAKLQRRLPVVPLAGAAATFQPVYVGDVATAWLHALRDPHAAHQVYQLGGPGIYTLAELVRLAGRYAGCERPVIELPATMARLQARFFELLPGEPLLTRDNLDSMKVDNVLAPGMGDLTAASLGIKLTPLEAVAPHYLASGEPLDRLRTRAGR
ncbi:MULTISPECIES: complex I NDUFA9 subunit family protein [unclassified Massilia]|uniref:complex I NDUFA9 subunit family protein n=1 Tax=unclassified Massilia TaxID=2609279 RepID=UPI001783B565|nr:MULTISPECIES: complex I NDUFA9 subunit family protein [unclassified Massilia]MBD8532415.1 complex I NDUFA9 subunit family protein [Massilia sp. CFBP 13647]MBD8675759.1 complex I NDUFA9 subunit family protein [Massilia sp. CFBP 13721]